MPAKATVVAGPSSLSGSKGKLMALQLLHSSVPGDPNKVNNYVVCCMIHCAMSATTVNISGAEQIIAQREGLHQCRPACPFHCVPRKRYSCGCTGIFL